MSGSSDVRLRPAERGDLCDLWRWRNDPRTRAASFDGSEIALDAHRRWFEETLQRGDCLLYVARVAGGAAGTLRLDVTGAEAAVSITIAPEWRGRGLASAALLALCRTAFEGHGLVRLTAQIKRANRASERAFERAGFSLAEEHGNVRVLARTAPPPPVATIPGRRVRAAVTIQARLGSTRLPGKVLLPVAGRPLMAWIVDRLRAVRDIDEIVIATSTAAADDALEAFAARHGVACVRGSQDDVVQRLLTAARQTGADAIVRITGDCPLVDPEIVDLVTQAFRARAGDVDYVSNVYPSTFPHGLDVEILSRPLLERLDREIDDPFYRDWFSAYLREHPDGFTWVNVRCADTRPGLRALRWTVDHPEDLRFVDEVFGRLGERGGVFGMRDVLALLEREPSLREINRHLEDTTNDRWIRSATYHRLLAERQEVHAHPA